MRWFNLLGPWHRLRRLASVFAGMMMLVLSGHAWATASCSGTANSYTLTLPSSISVPRDAAVGTVLTPWVASPAVTNWYNCNVTNSTYTGAKVRALSLTASGLKVTNKSVSTTVWNTNLAGVGIALQISSYANGCGWQPTQDVGDQTSTTAPWVGTSCNANGAITNGGQVTAAFVKTGPITGGTVSAGPVAEAAPYVEPGGMQPAGPLQTFSTTSTAVTVLSCITPDVTVNLLKHLQSEFTKIGSTTAAVNFNISLNSCPAGINTVQYQIDATTTILDPTNAVVALDSSGTATGVGVQLLTSAGAVQKLGVPVTFSGYQTTGGNFQIPLQARYYQTAVTVGPGDANTSMVFTMTYQ